MALKRREFIRKFKLRVITEVEGGKPMVPVAREHQVNPIMNGSTPRTGLLLPFASSSQKPTQSSCARHFCDEHVSTFV